MSLEHNVHSHVVTYEEFRSNNYCLEADSNNMASYLTTPCRVQAMLSCPNNCDESLCALYFIIVDDVIAGRVQLFGSKLKIGKDIIKCGSGSSLEVADHYRHMGIGAEIMAYFTYESGYPVFLTAGISNMAVPLYHALKYKDIKIPVFSVLYNCRKSFEERGLKGIKLNISSFCLNSILYAVRWVNNRKSLKLRNVFEVRKEEIVPTWIDNIVLNDGHKYAEVHDHQWMQWVLENGFHKDNPKNINSYYSIYKEKKPVGFFLTKERYRKDDKFGDGSIMEWGTLDTNIINEAMIYKLALSTFSNDVVRIIVASNDIETMKQLKKMLFRYGGDHHIMFMGSKRLYPDAGEANLWRVRLGYADTVLV